MKEFEIMLFLHERRSLTMLSVSTILVKCFVLQITLFKTVHANEENGYCGAEFQDKCWCGLTEYDRSQKYVVNCTNGGFADTSVLEHMPATVQVLIFTGNVLVNLPWNIFGKISEYPKLRVIDMSNNHIREIRGKLAPQHIYLIYFNGQKDLFYTTRPDHLGYR